MQDVPMKECRDCGPRPITAFRRRPGDRLNSRCRRCTRRRSAQARAQEAAK